MMSLYQNLAAVAAGLAEEADITERILELDDAEIVLVAGGHGNHEHTKGEAEMEGWLRNYTGTDWHCTTNEEGTVVCQEVGTFSKPKEVSG